jgi:adenosylhomocysteine nucleosidase
MQSARLLKANTGPKKSNNLQASEPLPHLRPQSPVLIAFAVSNEARPLRSLVTAAWPVTVQITGIGAKAARRSLSPALSRVRPSLVLTSGFAGGLNPCLRSGDIVYEATAAQALVPCLEGLGTATKFLSVERVVSTVAEKQRLHRSTGADAIEMESAAIRSLCLEAGIACATVRIISDAADEALPLDFDSCLGPEGRLIPSRILLQCARRPAAIPALLRLQSVTRQAARRLAFALVQVLKAWWAHA